MQLRKIDAATSQLETAIRLYFSDGDPVSIHTLACAACDLIRDMGRSLGHEGLTAKEWSLEYVKPEYRGEVRALLAASQNFFKHADRDPTAVLDFNPDEPRARILDGCNAFKTLTLDVTPLMQLFQLRAALTWAKDFFGYQGLETASELTLSWAELPNCDFLEQLLPDMERAHVIHPRV